MKDVPKGEWVQIYIVRHGDAINRDDPRVTSDEMRELTSEGRDEVELMSLLLARLDVKPDLILTSPLIRARQTAEIIASVTGAQSAPSVSDELAPGGSLAAVLNDILSHGRPKQTVLTGHMPGVGAMAAYLIWREPHMALPFRTGEICRVDLPDDSPVAGYGDLRWAIPPRIASRLIGTS
jgi:phosphohistidine phosphatase